MKVIIKRTFINDKQSVGALHVVKNDRVVFTCNTLELPYKGNKKRISSIPIGQYKVVKRTSTKFKEHFHILNVPNRDYILIHKGNYHTQILGCVLVGSNFKDINKDGYIDVVSSTSTMKQLLNILPDSFDLLIS